MLNEEVAEVLSNNSWLEFEFYVLVRRMTFRGHLFVETFVPGFHTMRAGLL